MARRRSSTFSPLDDFHNYNINERDRTIYLCSDMGEDESVIDFKVANKFLKNLDYLNSLSSEPITIKIDSDGGCYHHGMMIYDAIKSSKSPITTETHSGAYSMSAIIPQAASYRYISKHAPFMIHYGSISMDAEYRQVKNYVDFSEKGRQIMIDILLERCINSQFVIDKNLSRAKAKRFLIDRLDRKVDWWMSAEDAVYYGFMDGIL